MFVLATMAMVACEKENPNAGKLQLVAEGMGGNTKMAINGNSSYWVDGDSVNINGTEYAITVNSGSAYVDEDVSVTAPYLGVYPAGIINSISGHNYTLTLPAEYTYATTTYNSQTMQNLASPMVAYANGGNQLYFKHVTAAIGVEITNDFGIDVRVTNITVSSNMYKLHGSTTVTLGNTITVSAESTDNAALRTVQMNFNDAQLVIASGASATVQVPVLPVGDDNCFTISVTVQNKDDAAMEYTFSKTQGDSQDHYALDRAQMGYAPAKFGGVFTVASGKQVRFAPSNLQYYLGSVGEGVSRWSFKTHQYDRTSSITSGYYTTGTTQPDKDGYIDLFGWGASGIVGSATRYLPWQYAWSGTFREDVENADMSTSIDWGYNKIKNGGNENGMWRTLTSEEWSYLLNTRVVGEYVNSISRATVENVPGIIILPDNFVDPKTNASTNYTSFYPGPNSSTIAGFSDNVYSGTGWAAMQAAGAVFLPACGYRSGASTLKNYSDNYIWYWTATSGDATKTYANAMTHNGGNSAKPSTANSQSRLFGMPVRLVRDVQ